MVEEFQKDAITIPDELGLIVEALNDDLRNHKLKHIMDLENIVTKAPETWDELPAIYVRKSAFATLMRQEALPSGGIGNIWESDFEFHLITSDDSYINYPPADAGELDDESTRHDGAENVLNVMQWLIHTFFSENTVYASSTIPTFQWDDVQPVGYELVDGNYSTRDIWAIILVYRFHFEVEMRE